MPTSQHRPGGGYGDVIGVVDQASRCRGLFRGPFIAALVITALVSGRTGLRQWLAALGRWRVGIGWALVAMLSPVALFVVSAVLLRLVGQPWPDLGLLVRHFGDIGWLFGALLAAAVYDVGEEPGWRGFALPPRLQRRWNALTAALVVGGLWSLWHLPFFAYRYQMSGVTVVFFVLGVLAGSVWLTFLYNATRGSVLMVMAWHVSWNVVNVLAAVASDALVALLTVEVIVAAVCVVVIWKPTHLAPVARHTLDPAGAAERGARLPVTAHPPLTPVGAGEDSRNRRAGARAD